MKYVKMLGLLAVAAAALMAFAGTASATLTSPSGTSYSGTIHSSSEGSTSLTGTITITCSTSTVKGSVTTNDANESSGPISELTFESCGNHTVEVINTGTLKITDTGTGTGTLSSNGAKVTILLHSAFLGTVHCIYKTTNTDLGSVTGGTPATLTISSVSLERESTDFGCGSDSTWEGSYSVETPGTLLID